PAPDMRSGGLVGRRFFVWECEGFRKSKTLLRRRTLSHFLIRFADHWRNRLKFVPFLKVNELYALGVAARLANVAHRRAHHLPAHRDEHDFIAFRHTERADD